MRVSLAKLGPCFPEFPSSSELGLAMGEIAGGKQGRGKQKLDCSKVQARGPGPGATDLPGHPRLVCGSAGWHSFSGLTKSPPPPSSSSVQVHVQLCSTECQLLPWVPGWWWSEAAGDWQIPLCPPRAPCTSHADLQWFQEIRDNTVSGSDQLVP